MNTTNIPQLLKKYEIYISNIEWHIKTNDPPDDEIKKLNSQIDHYTEVINDLRSLLQPLAGRWVNGGNEKLLPEIDDWQDYPKEYLCRMKGDDPRSGYIAVDYLTAEKMRTVFNDYDCEYWEWLDESNPATLQPSWERGEAAKESDLVITAKELLHLHLCEQEGMLSGKPTRQQWLEAVDKLSEALSGNE